MVAAAAGGMGGADRLRQLVSADRLALARRRQRVDAAAPALAARPEQLRPHLQPAGLCAAGDAAGAGAGSSAWTAAWRRCATPPRWPPCCRTRSRSDRTCCRCACRRCWTGCSTPSGAAAGALLGLWLARTDALGWLHRTGELWFAQRSRSGLMLLVLWPIGLLFPTPVALGLGQVWERVRDALRDAFDGGRRRAAGALVGGGAACHGSLVAGGRTAGRRARIAGAVPDDLQHGAARPAPRLARAGRHRARLRGHHAVDGAELRPATRVGVVHRQQPRRTRARLRDRGAAAGQRPAHRSGHRAWWWSPQASAWWRRHRPTPTSRPACSAGNRGASSAFTAWRSGSAGVGRMRRRCGCCARAPDGNEPPARRAAPYNAPWAGSPCAVRSRT